MFSYSANVTPDTSTAPASPASAPLARNARVVTRSTSILPATAAALGFAPTTRNRKPDAVDLMNHQAAAHAATAIAKQRCKRVVGPKRGSCAAAAIVAVCG